MMKKGSHFVFTRRGRLPCGIFRLEGVVDLDVQVALVLLIRSALQIALDTLALLDCQDFAQVEDGLLPVRVLGVRARRETNGLVAGSELDVEPSYQSVHEVVAADLELKGRGEREICNTDGVEVER